MDLQYDLSLPLRDFVFQTLKNSILSGELKPGERLMEVHLAKDLGVSRTPVRDAIRKLEIEGLVTMVPRKGAHVANLSEKNLKDVLEVRQALDELAVVLSCERITDSDIVLLKNTQKDFIEAVKNENLHQIASKDVDFHNIIYKSTNNARLIEIVQSLAQQMYRFRFEHIKNPNTHPILIREHEEILSAVADRDKEKALVAIRKHIYSQEQSVSKRIRDNQ